MRSGRCLCSARCGWHRSGVSAVVPSRASLSRGGSSFRFHDTVRAAGPLSGKLRIVLYGFCGHRVPVPPALVPARSRPFRTERRHPPCRWRASSPQALQPSRPGWRPNLFTPADHGLMIDPGLRDRIVLVTGANSGIGAATAHAFAAQGAAVVLHYLDAAAPPGDGVAASRWPPPTSPIPDPSRASSRRRRHASGRWRC
jgi:hypothetical protein